VSNSSSVSKAKVCEHTDNCINRDIIAQLEAVKLDLKTLESRLFTSISQQESKFDDINSMHVKQKEMESTIKQKHEEIHKLKLEIQDIKGSYFSSAVKHKIPYEQ
jgi:ethanolamine utilization protein EutQ (cupin superfamily)